jgi:hypothetical protein
MGKYSFFDTAVLTGGVAPLIETVERISREVRERFEDLDHPDEGKSRRVADRFRRDLLFQLARVHSALGLSFEEQHRLLAALYRYRQQVRVGPTG